MENKYTIDFSKLRTDKAIKATLLMFLRGRSGTVIYTIYEAGSGGGSVTRRHPLDLAKPIDEHASMITDDLVNNFLQPHGGRVYTHVTLEVRP